MKWEAIPSLFFFLFLGMLAECCFGRGGDIVEQDLDLSEGSSAQVQNKGNENDF